MQYRAEEKLQLLLHLQYFIYCICMLSLYKNKKVTISLKYLCTYINSCQLLRTQINQISPKFSQFILYICTKFKNKSTDIYITLVYAICYTYTYFILCFRSSNTIHNFFILCSVPKTIKADRCPSLNQAIKKPALNWPFLITQYFKNLLEEQCTTSPCPPRCVSLILHGVGIIL